jgi:formyl-CoA transferase
MGDALQCQRAQPPLGNENPMRVPSDTYPTKDGRFICVAVVNDRHWPPFCRAVDRQEWIGDPRFATMTTRIDNRAELRRLVEAAFRERPLADWMSRLDRERVAHAPVYDYVEALNDPQIVHRGMVQEVDHPRSGRIRIIGPPWITSESPPLTPPPLLGQHTAEVLANWLGWSEDAVGQFMNGVRNKAAANRGLREQT